MNFFNFLQIFNPFNLWSQLFPPPSSPEPVVDPEPEDPQDFDLGDEDTE